MMLTLEDVVRSNYDQLLGILTAWQQGAIEAHYAWVKAISPLVPDLNVYHEMPTMLQDALGDPDKIMDHNFNFVVAVANLQREFMREIFMSSFMAPRTPHVPPAR